MHSVFHHFRLKLYPPATSRKLIFSTKQDSICWLSKIFANLIHDSWGRWLHNTMMLLFCHLFARVGFLPNVLPFFGLLLFHEKDLSKATAAQHAHLQLRLEAHKSWEGVQRPTVWNLVTMIRNYQIYMIYMTLCITMKCLYWGIGEFHHIWMFVLCSFFLKALITAGERFHTPIWICLQTYPCNQKRTWIYNYRRIFKPRVSSQGQPE